MTELTEILNLRLHQRDIGRLVQTADKEAVYRLIFNADSRIAYNALWVLTHLPAQYNQWLAEKRRPLIDMLLKESHIGKKRLLFNLLNRLPIEAKELHTDYLDFCLSKVNSAEPYAIRAFALKQAYAQARHFPELVNELRLVMELLSGENLSPGLKSAVRQVTRKLGDG